MQHHSTTKQETSTATALLLNIVKEQESSSATEPFRLHVVASKSRFTQVHTSYHPSRRYTRDDNGGSYEGL